MLLRKHHAVIALKQRLWNKRSKCSQLFLSFIAKCSSEKTAHLEFKADQFKTPELAIRRGTSNNTTNARTAPALPCPPLPSMMVSLLITRFFRMRLRRTKDKRVVPWVWIMQPEAKLIFNEALRQKCVSCKYTITGVDNDVLLFLFHYKSNIVKIVINTWQFFHTLHNRTAFSLPRILRLSNANLSFSVSPFAMETFYFVPANWNRNFTR